MPACKPRKTLQLINLWNTIQVADIFVAQEHKTGLPLYWGFNHRVIVEDGAGECYVIAQATDRATILSDLRFFNTPDVSRRIHAAMKDGTLHAHLSALAAETKKTVQSASEPAPREARTMQGELQRLLQLMKDDSLDAFEDLLRRAPHLVCVPEAEMEEAPLHFAAAEGRSDFAQMLLDHGANVNQKDRNQWTPLLCAANSGKLATMALLINRGADVMAQTDSGNTALHLVAKRHQLGYTDPSVYIQVLHLLFLHGGDVNARNKAGETPLHRACYPCCMQHIVTLISFSVPDVNIRNAYGETCLHYAVRDGRRDVVRFLLENNADITITGASGTPIDVARAEGHESVLDLLLTAEKELLKRKNRRSRSVMPSVDHGHSQHSEWRSAGPRTHRRTFFRTQDVQAPISSIGLKSISTAEGAQSADFVGMRSLESVPRRKPERTMVDVTESKPQAALPEFDLDDEFDAVEPLEILGINPDEAVANAYQHILASVFHMPYDTCLEGSFTCCSEDGRDPGVSGVLLVTPTCVCFHPHSHVRRHTKQLPFSSVAAVDRPKLHFGTCPALRITHVDNSKVTFSSLGDQEDAAWDSILHAWCAWHGTDDTIPPPPSPKSDDVALGPSTHQPLSVLESVGSIGKFFKLDVSAMQRQHKRKSSPGLSPRGESEEAPSFHAGIKGQAFTATAHRNSESPLPSHAHLLYSAQTAGENANSSAFSVMRVQSSEDSLKNRSPLGEHALVDDSHDALIGQDLSASDSIMEIQTSHVSQAPEKSVDADLLASRLRDLRTQDGGDDSAGVLLRHTAPTRVNCILQHQASKPPVSMTPSSFPDQDEQPTRANRFFERFNSKPNIARHAEMPLQRSSSSILAAHNDSPEFKEVVVSANMTFSRSSSIANMPADSASSDEQSNDGHMRVTPTLRKSLEWQQPAIMTPAQMECSPFCPPEGETSGRDLYAFQIEADLGPLYEAATASYIRTFRVQRQEWRYFNSRHSLRTELRAGKRSFPLMQLISRGIPFESRGMFWYQASGAQEKHRWSRSDYYSTLMQQATSSGSAQEIQKDICRTFPSHPFFMKEEGQRKLQHILLAYSIRNPVIGYCQAMNYIAAFILLFLPDEEKAFWVLVTVVEDVLLDYFTRSMIGSLVDQHLFRALLSEVCPRLDAAMERFQVPLTALTSHWFMCAYVGSLPTETALHIWDWFLLEGSDVLMYVGIALLKNNEKSIIASRSLSSAMDTIRECARIALDDQRLIRSAMKLRSRGKLQSDKFLHEKRLSIYKEIAEQLETKKAQKQKQQLMRLQKDTHFEIEELRALLDYLRATAGSDMVIAPPLLADILAVMWPALSKCPELVRQLFRVLDTYNNGTVACSNLVSALSVIARGTVQERLGLMFSCFDTDEDGLLSRADFSSGLEMLRLLHKGSASPASSGAPSARNRGRAFIGVRSGDTADADPGDANQQYPPSDWWPVTNIPDDAFAGGMGEEAFCELMEQCSEAARAVCPDVAGDPLAALLFSRKSE